jgi:hypothetical protein
VPIRLTIDHLNRVVVGVGEGVLTIEDLVTFGLEVLKAKVLPYGKIIDVATCQPGFTEGELRAFAQIAREKVGTTQRGPLALVVDPTRGEMAKFFTNLDLEGRPANVFRSLREARQWMTQLQADERSAAIPSRTRPPR